MCAQYQPDSDIEEIDRPSSLPPNPRSSNPLRVILKLPKTPPPPARTSTVRKLVEVKPPRLSSSQLKQYKPANESSLKEDPITRVDEIIGEHEQDGRLYYFARYDGGIARKVRVDSALAPFRHKREYGYFFSSRQYPSKPDTKPWSMNTVRFSTEVKVTFKPIYLFDRQEKSRRDARTF